MNLDVHFQINFFFYAFIEKNHSEIKSIDSYTFDKSETKILIATNSNPIFRRSFTANFFVYDIAAKKITKFTEKAIQEPTFSPEGNKIGYAFENNLFVFDLSSNIETQITTDGKKNHIITNIML